MAEPQSNTKRKVAAAVVGIIAVAGIVAASVGVFDSEDKKAVTDAQSSLRSGEVQSDDTQLDNSIYGWIPSSDECDIGMFGCAEAGKKKDCSRNSGCTWSRSTRQCSTKDKCRCYDIPEEGCTEIDEDEEGCKEFSGCEWQTVDKTCEMLDECIPVGPDVGPRPTDPTIDGNTTDDDIDYNGTLVDLRFLDGNETDGEGLYNNSTDGELVSNSTDGELVSNSTDEVLFSEDEVDRRLAHEDDLLNAYLAEHRLLEDSNSTDEEELYNNVTDGELFNNSTEGDLNNNSSRWEDFENTTEIDLLTDEGDGELDNADAFLSY